MSQQLNSPSQQLNSIVLGQYLAHTRPLPRHNPVPSSKLTPLRQAVLKRDSTVSAQRSEATERALVLLQRVVGALWGMAAALR